MRHAKRMIFIGFGMVAAGLGGAYAQFGTQLFAAANTQTISPVQNPTVNAAQFGSSDLPPPVSSIDVDPAFMVSGLDHQFGINNRGLEISNVRLGKLPTQGSERSHASSMKLASVATHRQFQFQKPKNPNAALAVSGLFSLGPDQSVKIDAAAIQVASAEIDPAALKIASENRLLLPQIPNLGVNNSVFSTVSLTDISNRLLYRDDSRRRPAGNLALDQSPFGSPCLPGIQATALGSAMVRLNISAPCHPNAAVKISHGRLVFSEHTSHTGELQVTVPAFDEKALFTAEFASGQRLQTSIHVPDMASVVRVAVLWQGDFELNLQAHEFGAVSGSLGHVNANNARSVAQADHFGGGYISVLGKGALPSPLRAEVYSLPVSESTPKGAVRLSVMAQATIESCGKSAVITNVKSVDGQTISAGGLRFSLPDCQAEQRAILVKHAVSDIITGLD